MCELLKTRLSEQGYDVFVAQDGLQGLQIYEEVKPQLVITDLMLPSLNGYQLIRKIKNNDREFGNRDSKIIVLTGRRTENDIERCFELGAADYVRKPFSPIELEARIRKQLES
jgi:two-component system OmpR family response regulator